MDLLPFLNKWIHLASMAGVFGGILFAWLVLIPSEADARGAGNENAVRAMWKRFGMPFGVLWLLALVTGFINYGIVSGTVVGRYHMFLGMKMMLAILMFIASMLLAHPMPALERFTSERRPILLGLLTFGVIVLGISGFLNMSRVNGSLLKKPAAAAESPQSTSTPPVPQP
jgi:hypothetical protein